MKFVEEELPAETGRGPRMISNADLEELRSRPGEWAVVKENENLGSHKAKPKYLGDDFEWTTRVVEGRRNYYVRFQPPTS